jgi:hypothetical protein
MGFLQYPGIDSDNSQINSLLVTITSRPGLKLILYGLIPHYFTHAVQSEVNVPKRRTGGTRLTLELDPDFPIKENVMTVNKEWKILKNGKNS